jgi:hypothetical protein
VEHSKNKSREKARASRDAGGAVIADAAALLLIRCWAKLYESGEASMNWMKKCFFIVGIALAVAGCGKDEQRDQEIQKAIQEGTQKERQLYEGMQKGVENLEKSVQEQMEGQKKSP